MRTLRQDPLLSDALDADDAGGRSCHTAINEANAHLKDGYEWVADLDLEKFFDLVCHQRLTAQLAKRVSDRRLPVLIGQLLKAKVVLPDTLTRG